MASKKTIEMERRDCLLPKSTPTVGNEKSPPSSPCSINPQPQYKLLKVLGYGAFGNVFKCYDQVTDRCVAIKKFTREKELQKELKMLTFLMENNLHEQNVIRFFRADLDVLYLVLELCDISLRNYLKQLQAPMPLQDIRLVIQQLATTFDALKKVGVIHADLKTDNVMLVDQTREPLQVKLIDFNLSVFTKDAQSTRINQVLLYKAPELILGLPYSEALDIWSLGCVMSEMVFNCHLFPARDEYELLYYMTRLLGPPPKHLLDAGRESVEYFYKDKNQWLLKKPQECLTDLRTYTFCTLDDAKTIQWKMDNPNEARERRECIELLKAMLNWDASKRITPSKILAHPFITMDYSRSNSSSLESISNLDSEPCNSKALNLHKTKSFAPRICWEFKLSDSNTCENITPFLDVLPAANVKHLSMENESSSSYSSCKRKPQTKKNCLKQIFCCCILNSNDEDGESFTSSD